MNTPLHIVDGCSMWPALQKWTDSYLVDKFNRHLIVPKNVTSLEEDKLFTKAHGPLPYTKFKFEIQNSVEDWPVSFGEFIEKKQGLKDKFHSLVPSSMVE